uniref:Uncharacterized protein n=1 Tax=Ananas comosus var. bracteatus TaxID=296719 RepID=A0A6V7PB09_ANACO|nr:unnamed protein product [Ananas comosus var. bracteatus]
MGAEAGSGAERACQTLQTLPFHLQAPPPPPPPRSGDPRGGGGGRRRGGGGGASSSSAGAPSVVIVTGIPGDCTVLELKSRLEIYGPSPAPASTPPMAWGTSPSAPPPRRRRRRRLTRPRPRRRRPIQEGVCGAGERSLQQWKTGVGASPSLSKLLRPETPLSKHGRSNKKLNPNTTIPSERREPDLSFKGREIVAYDDLF